MKITHVHLNWESTLFLIFLPAFYYLTTGNSDMKEVKTSNFKVVILNIKQSVLAPKRNWILKQALHYKLEGK